MGRKPKTETIIKKIIQRKEDKDIEKLTKDLIYSLQINENPLIQLTGDVMQELNDYWYVKYENLYNKNLEEWDEEIDKRNLEIDKRQLYQETAESLSVYLPFYGSYRKIYNRNKGMKIDEIKTEYITKIEDNSILWEKRKSDLSIEEIELLEKHKKKIFRRVPAFIIFCHRFKNDMDFPIKVNLNDYDNIMDQYDKFIKQFDKSPQSKI